MKKLLCLLAVALLPVSAATISLVPSSVAVAPGQEFMLDVMVHDNGDEILSFGFNTFTSDPARAMLVGYTVGDLFIETPVGGTEIFAVAFPFVTDPEVLLATLTFRAGGPGAVTVGVWSNPDNLNEGLVQLAAGYTPIDAQASVNVVPEPASMALFGLGAAALLLLRKAR